ncbi:nucleotidyltransferase domain-containing protein [Candidatus Bathyarchaeota archaeon]|nr:nucleotidyltransferase domain-containing protein [Candidatus Bathyarchaeota archaeon]
MAKTGGQVRVTYPALSRRQVVERLRQAYRRLKIKLPVSKMILYGSYATGRYTAGSDIDLLVVYEGERREDAYKLVSSEIALPRLEPKVYTQREFNILISRSRKFAVTLNSEGVEIS